MKQEKILVEVFVRHCKLCGDPLPHNCHAKREFCPWKNGRSNDCKLKFVEILKQMKLVGSDTNTKKDPPQKPLPSIKNVEPNKKNLGGMEVESLNIIDIREENIGILAKLLGDTLEIEVGERILLKAGYDATVYDVEIPYLFDDLLSYNIGPYSIIPLRPNVYLLTNKGQ